MSTAAVNLAEVAALWRNARRLYPIYAALNQQSGYGLQPCRDLESPIDRSDSEVIKRVQDWLSRIDARIEVHQLRQLFQTTHIATETGLNALLKHELEREKKDNTVRDKVDYLLVQYYAFCAPDDAHASAIDFDHVSEVLQPVLGEVSPLMPAFCNELDKILTELDQCVSLGDLLNKKIIDRARAMKDQAGAEYFKPSVLVAYARFNFLLRRGFFRLMHADLHAIRFAIHAMEGRGQHSCDCSSAGLAPVQNFTELREICHDWKKPFRAAYSLGNTFVQLVKIRFAVETALARPLPVKPVVPAAPVAKPPVTAAPVVAAAKPASAPVPAAVPVSKPAPPAAPATVVAPVAPKPVAPPAPVAAASVSTATEELIGQIHIAVSSMPVKNAAVCSFVLKGTKVILASWEVIAFQKPNSPAATRVQNAVASRVLLIQAVEARKRGDISNIATAIAQAHSEAAHLQAEIASAKDRKDIDTAVNLAATAKRLLALVEQTEKGK